MKSDDPTSPTTSTTPPHRAPRDPQRVIGWREWVALPSLGIDRVKAKIDTGARSSSLHAYNIRFEESSGEPYVIFSVHPTAPGELPVAQCRYPLLDHRWVTSSNGDRQRRPVIRVPLHMDGMEWDIDLTLTSRDLMGFRMLLGREAFRKRFVVNAARSFLIRELAPPRVRRKKKAISSSTD